MKIRISLGIWMTAAAVVAAPATLTLTGDWQVRVEKDGVAATLTVAVPETVAVTDERYNALPLYNTGGANYARGAKLIGVRAQECSVRYALDPASLAVRVAPGGAAFVRGTDYEAELTWGCVGRLAGGQIAETTPVYASYTYGKMRLDAVVLTAGGQIILREGVSHVSLPVSPELATGETRLANVWVTARMTKLDTDHLFPVLETTYPQPPKNSQASAEKFLPKTIAKLNAGGPVHVLAWGDSVTDGGFLPEPATNRWQAQFVRRLQERYPNAEIILTTEAWGGRNTDSYRKEPPGSLHNYQEKVLDVHPDLIVSEFVNDAGLNEAAVYQRYGLIRDEFKAIGAEWIILTPHYVRPDMMGLTSEKNIDDDPRAYVKALRKFTAEHGIALAEGSLRFGRLWRQGIPYSTLLMNNINHPNPFGMSLFADALMEVLTVVEAAPETSTLAAEAFEPPAQYAGLYGAFRSPLKFDSGDEVKTREQWGKRRAEILKNWHARMGEWPPLITGQKLEYVETVRRENFTQHHVRFNWTPNERTDGYLLVPDGKGPKPAVITVFYDPETAIGLSKKPYRDFAYQLTKSGFVTLSLGTREASARHEFSLYYPGLDNAQVQPLSMLAYAAANAWNVLANVEGVDPARIGIMGHSFGGKWAMFASCLYEKFACAVWSDPGIAFGEDRPSVNYWEPWYLGYHPRPWRKRGLMTADNPGKGLYLKLRSEGYDLTDLHALMAPRPFLVSGGSEDPPERWVALNHSIQVNTLLGYDHRVAMTNRPEHSPDPEAIRQMVQFFTQFLRP